MKNKLAVLSVLVILFFNAMGHAGGEEAKAAQQAAPFYSNWIFWQWVVSLSALIISLTPYVVRLIKGTRISLDLMNRIFITHTLGNPNVNLFLIIHNNGGIPVRIRSITLEISKDEKKLYTIPAKTYFPESSESKQAVLAPFRLLPDQDWSHGVYFYPDFSREEEIEYRKINGALKANIQAKIPLVRPQVSQDTEPAVYETDPQFLGPVLQFFENHFMWNTGEYTGTVTIHAEPQRATVSKKFRFTLFETESTELRHYSHDYKYGLGVYYFNSEKHPNISVFTSEI